MIVSPFRIVGQPLHYFNPYPKLEVPDDIRYIQNFVPYHTTMEMPMEIMASSPISTQSDSDNSVSSVEIPQKELGIVNNIIKFAEKSQVQCRWKSCGIFYSSLDQLSSHISQVHSASGLGGLFYCGWDGCSRNNKSFNARYKMLVHVRTHTNEKPHKCFQCDKSFSRAENLKIHTRSHSGEKPYACTVPGCNKAYSNSSDRFKHTRTHQVEKPYQCKVPGCPKKYTDPSSLRKHTKTFRHFVVEKTLVDDNLQNSEVRRNEMMSTQPIYRENVIRHPCGCSKGCSVSSCNSHTDILRIEALINIRNEKKSLSTWNRYIEPYFDECSRDFSYYEESIQVDVPLDLSVHRKNF
nr:zinc finger protein GLIS2 homolog [Leptinotarsa decemlineata]